jgi:ribosomal protein L37AE/L43A
MVEKNKMTSSIRHEVRNAERKLSGKRYCTSCQQMKNNVDGKMIIGKIMRWKCSYCIKQISQPKYATKK